MFAVTELQPITSLSAEIAPLVANVLLLLITGIVGLASRQIVGWLRASTTNKQQEVLFNFARQAVLAAEQLGLTGDINDKKVYAFDLINDFLAQKGISLTAAQIEAAVEAAVNEEFTKPTVEVETDDATVTVTPGTNTTTPDEGGPA